MINLLYFLDDFFCFVFHLGEIVHDQQCNIYKNVFTSWRDRNVEIRPYSLPLVLIRVEQFPVVNMAGLMEI